MSLLTVEEARLTIQTALTDVQLQLIIDRVEGELAGRLGPLPPVDSIVEDLLGFGVAIFARRPIDTVISLVVDGRTLATSQYRVVGGAGMVERIDGSKFSTLNTLTYKPNDNQLLWKSAISGLVRIELERTAMKSESVGGEYSYTAPDSWEAERRALIRRLQFTEV